MNRAPTSVEESLEALETVARWLRARRDPRAAFADVYAVITRRVKAAIDDPRSALFLEPAWISRLTGLFCTRYFDYLFAALEGRPIEGAAWAMADLHARKNDVAPAVHALLGINAHINYDLALGLLDNVVRVGAAEDARQLARFRHDHNAVNAILRDAMPEIYEVLARRHGCVLSRVIGSSPHRRYLVTKAVLRALVDWRDRVWDDLLDLLKATTEGELETSRTRMDKRSATIARAAAALGAGSALVERALGANAEDKLADEGDDATAMAWAA